jgi:hypothetical protein
LKSKKTMTHTPDNSLSDELASKPPLPDYQARPQASGSSLSWVRGFLESIRSPEDINALRNANVWKIYIAGALLLAISYTLSAWMIWSSLPLREQMMKLLAAFPGMKAGSAAAGGFGDAFPWPAALGSTLVQTGLIGLGVQSVMIWLVQRVLLREPLRMLAVLGVTSFATSITAIGYVINAVLQLATGSITTSASLAPLWSVTDHPFLVSYVQKADVFWLWQYAVIGVSIAAFTNNSRRMGVVIAVVAILVHSLFSASLAYMGYLQAVSMVK